MLKNTFSRVMLYINKKIQLVEEAKNHLLSFPLIEFFVLFLNPISMTKKVVPGFSNFLYNNRNSIPINSYTNLFLSYLIIFNKELVVFIYNPNKLFYNTKEGDIGLFITLVPKVS